MTLDEAMEAGELAKALDAVTTLAAKLAKNQKGAEDDRYDEFGLGLSVQMSESGAEGFGPDVVLGPQMTADILAVTRDLIGQRLRVLGVDVEGTDA